MEGGARPTPPQTLAADEERASRPAPRRQVLPSGDAIDGLAHARRACVVPCVANAQLSRDPSLGAIELREPPRAGFGSRLGSSRGTVEHLDLVLRRRARDLG